MVDEIEPLLRTNDEYTPTIGAIAGAGDFRSASRRGRADLSRGQRNVQKYTGKADHDEVVLSDVAHVSLLEKEGMSVNAIAADLGLTAAAVWTDLVIAAQICHPGKL
jgi:hypothetical protein